MKLHREISGEEPAKLFKKYGYQITRQTGSYTRLTTQLESKGGCFYFKRVE